MNRVRDRLEDFNQVSLYIIVNMTREYIDLDEMSLIRNHFNNKMWESNNRTTGDDYVGHRLNQSIPLSRLLTLDVVGRDLSHLMRCILRRWMVVWILIVSWSLDSILVCPCPFRSEFHSQSFHRPFLERKPWEEGLMLDRKIPMVASHNSHLDW